MNKFLAVSLLDLSVNCLRYLTKVRYQKTALAERAEGNPFEAVEVMGRFCMQQ